MEPLVEGRGRSRKVDLHLHSLASDGTLGPAEVVALAAQRGVEVIALTDHDTTLGIPAALLAGQEWGVEVISGIEMTVEQGEELHILAYFVDIDYPPLQATLARLRRQRSERARQMLLRLADLGMPLDWTAISRMTWDSVGRPHIARTLVTRGYISHPREAFDLYLDPGRPAYVPVLRPSAADTLGLIRAAGGLPVLAHPIIPGRDDPAERTRYVAALLPALKEEGLAGLECYYPDYTAETTRELVGLANSLGLIATGGSDYHGPYSRVDGPGGVAVPNESVERLREASRSLETGSAASRGGRWS